MTRRVTALILCATSEQVCAGHAIRSSTRRGLRFLRTAHKRCPAKGTIPLRAIIHEQNAASRGQPDGISVSVSLLRPKLLSLSLQTLRKETDTLLKYALTLAFTLSLQWQARDQH